MCTSVLIFQLAELTLIYILYYLLSKLRQLNRCNVLKARSGQPAVLLVPNDIWNYSPRCAKPPPAEEERTWCLKWNSVLVSPLQNSFSPPKAIIYTQRLICLHEWSRQLGGSCSAGGGMLACRGGARQFFWQPSCRSPPCRNNMPSRERLHSKLRRRRGARAYACQCSWRSALCLTHLRDEARLKWVCGKHQGWRSCSASCDLHVFLGIFANLITF